MLYQSILSEHTPYLLRIDRLLEFREHRHADIELHYCIRGSFEATVNKKRVTVLEGELLLIPPMVAHSFPDSKDQDRRIMLVILGVSFLKNFFSLFSDSSVDHRIIPLSSEQNPELYALIEETVALYPFRQNETELLIRGNLYKICAHLIRLTDMIPREKDKKIIKIERVEQALEMIHRDYARELTVEKAAKATGYGVSNFCKIFKHVTGETFHKALNRRRVENASSLLSETNLPISEIALMVGFGELKSFCRVFKEFTDLTPGQYRKCPPSLHVSIKKTGRS